MASSPDSNSPKEPSAAYDVLKTFESVDLTHRNFDAITAQIRDEINTLLQAREIEYDTVGSMDPNQYFHRNQKGTKNFASMRSSLDNKQIQGAVKHLSDALLADNAVGTQTKVHEILKGKIPEIQKVVDTFTTEESAAKPTITYIPAKERWTARLAKKSKSFFSNKWNEGKKNVKRIQNRDWTWKSLGQTTMAIPMAVWGAGKSTIPYFKAGYAWINSFLEYFDWSNEKFWVKKAWGDGGHGHGHGEHGGGHGHAAHSHEDKEHGHSNHGAHKHDSHSKEHGDEHHEASKHHPSHEGHGSHENHGQEDVDSHDSTSPKTNDPAHGNEDHSNAHH